MSVIVGEEGLTIPKYQSTKRKWGLDNVLVVSLSNYDTMDGVDTGMRYLLVVKTMMM